MTWLLKMEFETKECLDEWVDRVCPFGTEKDTCLLDVEYEELED